jgi:predicted transcriptional regulator
MPLPTSFLGLTKAQIEVYHRLKQAGPQGMTSHELLDDLVSSPVFGSISFNDVRVLVSAGFVEKDYRDGNGDIAYVARGNL